MGISVHARTLRGALGLITGFLTLVESFTALCVFLRLDGYLFVIAASSLGNAWLA